MSTTLKEFQARKRRKTTSDPKTTPQSEPVSQTDTPPAAVENGPAEAVAPQPPVKSGKQNRKSLLTIRAGSGGSVDLFEDSSVVISEEYSKPDQFIKEIFPE